jgi:hypothetical protein
MSETCDQIVDLDGYAASMRRYAVETAKQLRFLAALAPKGCAGEALRMTHAAEVLTCEVPPALRRR